MERKRTGDSIRPVIADNYGQRPGLVGWRGRLWGDLAGIAKAFFVGAVAKRLVAGLAAAAECYACITPDWRAVFTLQGDVAAKVERAIGGDLDAGLLRWLLGRPIIQALEV